ncbi:hypothetical protein KSP40_PGU014745 [Platanthera guangdongensis]|uniref:Pollen Ole e 1 allergen and extensin family protein n=1 Tax=Platanthera guangdongensis TaxID=2320717 RepID=A0ABR2LCE1_9ASPA
MLIASIVFLSMGWPAASVTLVLMGRGAGSKVAVTCLDSRRRVVYYGSDETDEKGDFNFPVDLCRYAGDHSKAIRPEGCSVRLVSSPEDACNVMTDFGGGRSGARFVRPSHVYPGSLKYTVGPFFFTSPMCEEPDTSDIGGS